MKNLKINENFIPEIKEEETLTETKTPKGKELIIKMPQNGFNLSSFLFHF